MKKSFYSKWILQRVTAIILIPLTFWFIYQCISFTKFQYSELSFFFQSYFKSFLFLIMMGVMLIHGKLGCETIIDDYISSINSKKIFKFIINFSTYSSFFLVFFSIIKILMQT